MIGARGVLECVVLTAREDQEMSHVGKVAESYLLNVEQMATSLSSLTPHISLWANVFGERERC